jgi:hypothetical protein
VSHYAQLFVMGEVAVELFQESPTAFLQVGVMLCMCYPEWAGRMAHSATSTSWEPYPWVHVFRTHVLSGMQAQELRKNKFVRLNSNSRDVLRTIAELQLPVESAAATSGGAGAVPGFTIDGFQRVELLEFLLC